MTLRALHGSPAEDAFFLRNFFGRAQINFRIPDEDYPQHFENSEHGQKYIVVCEAQGSTANNKPNHAHLQHGRKITRPGQPWKSLSMTDDKLRILPRYYKQNYVKDQTNKPEISHELEIDAVRRT